MWRSSVAGVQTTMSASLSVVVVDPSLFTLGYDDHLCSALNHLGCDVTLAGRSLRSGEQFLPSRYVKRPHFYALSERLRTSKLPRRLQSSIKGMEHLHGMAKFNSTIKVANPSVIHFQWLPIPYFDRLFLRRLRRRFPLVLTVHDSNPYNGSPLAPLQVAGTIQAMNEFDHLIVHTSSSRNRLVNQRIDPEKISVVPHGVLNAATAKPNPAGRRPARGAAGKKTTVLLFGKIKPYKGCDTLLEAIALMPRSQREKFNVLIVGDPCMDVAPLLQKARKAELADIVEFRMGFSAAHAIPELFASADVFVFPYQQIDASGALFECLPYGKPIIASRVGVFAEMLEDQKHGYLIEPGDPVGLARALLYIDPTDPGYDAMGESVALLSKTAKNWKEIGEMTLLIYEKAISLWKAKSLMLADA